jgi:hypothetical protein
MIIAADAFDLILSFGDGLAHLVIPHCADIEGLDTLRAAMAESRWTEEARSIELGEPLECSI